MQRDFTMNCSCFPCLSCQISSIHNNLSLKFSVRRSSQFTGIPIRRIPSGPSVQMTSSLQDIFEFLPFNLIYLFGFNPDQAFKFQKYNKSFANSCNSFCKPETSCLSRKLSSSIICIHLFFFFFLLPCLKLQVLIRSRFHVQYFCSNIASVVAKDGRAAITIKHFKTGNQGLTKTKTKNLLIIKSK